MGKTHSFLTLNAQMLCLAFLLLNAEIWLEFSHDFRELGQHIYGNAKISVKVGQS